MDAAEFQKMRVMRAAEMCKRALDRNNQALVNHWIAQFKVEVQRLNEVKEEGK